MKSLRYEAAQDYSRSAALKEVESFDSKRIVEGLLALSFFDNDWRFVQNLCLLYSKSDDENLRGISILCFGHIARIHRQIDAEIVKPILLEALTDSSDFVKGHAESALEDLEIFTRF